jgi:hypothetical protein
MQYSNMQTYAEYAEYAEYAKNIMMQKIYNEKNMQRICKLYAKNM